MTSDTYSKILKESEEIIKQLCAKDVDDAIRILKNKNKQKKEENTA